MTTKNTVYLIAGGTNYYLSGNGTTYTGSGTPWTSEATTPFKLSLNDETGGIWVPEPAEALTVYSGGPPFDNGRYPVYQSYDNQTITIGVRLCANSHDNAVYLKRLLATILNTALYSAPCVLAVKGGTNTAYYEVLAAKVAESISYLREPTGQWRALITLTITPHGTKASLDTLINAATFTNTGTGANNNFQSLGSLDGDLTSNIGHPMQIKLASPSTSGVFVGYAAIAKARTYSAHGTAISTTSTSFSDVATGSASFPSDDEGTALRLIARIANPNAALAVRAVVKINAVFTIATTREVSPGALGGAYVDLGYIELPRNLRRAKTTAITVTIQARSTTGGSATGTLTYTELVQYYTWARFETTFPSTSFNLFLVGADSSVGSYVRVISPPLAWLASSVGNNVASLVRPAGTFPRAFTGAGLYVAWTFAGAHDTAHTFSVTAQQAALYQTIRGGA